MMSVRMQKVYEFAQQMEDQIDLSLIKPHQVVEVNLEDGSRFRWMSALVVAIEYDGQDWIIVFPEHYTVQVFSKEDLLEGDPVSQYEFYPCEIERWEMK